MVEHVLRRQAAHPHQPVDNGFVRTCFVRTCLVVFAQVQMTLAIHQQRNHTEIDIPRQAPVQADFLLAIVAPCLDAAEVEKVLMYRFFQLVCILLREEDPGHVGFDRFNAVGTVGEARGLAQERDFGRKRNSGRRAYGGRHVVTIASTQVVSMPCTSGLSKHKALCCMVFEPDPVPD